MRKLLLLDRDGIINNEIGDYVFRQEDFVFNPSIFPFLKALQQKDYQFVVITNQGGIAKKRYDKAAVYTLHAYMQKEMEKQGIALLDIYFCPHHNEVEKCICRKPDSLMIEKVLARYNFLPENAYLLGDKQTDILAARKVGVKGILVIPNSNLMEQLHYF